MASLYKEIVQGVDMTKKLVLDACSALRMMWFDKDNPNVVFAATGEGIGMDYSVLSFHKNYLDFSNFIDNLKAQLADILNDVQSFLMATNEQRTLKSLSLKYLEKTWEQPT